MNQPTNDQHSTKQTNPFNDDLDSLMRQTDAARFLDYTPRALEAWRASGKGPKFVRVSPKSVRYRKGDLIDWIKERTVRSTSEASQG